MQIPSNPADNLAKEITHVLEMNFNKIPHHYRGDDARFGGELQEFASFGKEDTAKELQDHAAKIQDTSVDAVENGEVAESTRASSVL